MTKAHFKKTDTVKNIPLTRSRLKHLQEIRRVLHTNQPPNFTNSCSSHITTTSNDLGHEHEIKTNNSNSSKEFLGKHIQLHSTISLLPTSEYLLNKNDLKKSVEPLNQLDCMKMSNEIIDITDDTIVEEDDDVIIISNSDTNENIINIPGQNLPTNSISCIPLEVKPPKDNAHIKETQNISVTDDFIPLELTKENTDANEIQNISVIDITDDTIISENVDNKIDLNFRLGDDVILIDSSPKKEIKLDFSHSSNKNKKTQKKANKNNLKGISKKRRRKIKLEMKLHKCFAQVNIKRPNNSNISDAQSVQPTSNVSLPVKDFKSNMWNVQKVQRKGLREIIIDGSNVALGHSNGRFFSVKGLQIAIEYFLKKGHKVIAFVPQYRSKQNESSDHKLLNSLVDKGYVVFTPSREVNGRRITPYDDRYIIQYATACEGIVVSSDNYRDLFLEKPEWRTTIEQRLLMPTWVGDVLIFPEDPLGRKGPNLSSFLTFPA